jgi:hypothetical protein
MPNFAVKVPVVGSHVVIVEADTLEEAIRLIASEELDWDDEEDERVHGALSLTGYQSDKATAAEPHELAMIRQAFEVDNE